MRNNPRIRRSDRTARYPRFYLFVCLEHLPQVSNHAIVSALAVVDGNVLNDDFELYLSITGERTKRIELGTYSDGVDRARPMLIFANPLGAPEFSRGATLIHADSAIASSGDDLALAFILKRSVPGGYHTYHCYRPSRNKDGVVRELVDPFPTPRRDTRLAREIASSSRLRCSSCFEQGKLCDGRNNMTNWRFNFLVAP